MSSVFNKNCCQKKIKNPKYVGYRRYKRVFKFGCKYGVLEKKARKYDKLLELIHGRI